MITLDVPCAVMDIVGTGGDSANTFNISTGSSLLAACAGVKVIKHGNRAVTSQCGSADVLESLGIAINLSSKEIIDNLNYYNFAFCFAPRFHPALARLKELRSQLGIRTIFNTVSPLLNPARARYLMIGIADKNLLPLIAGVIEKLEVERAVVFHCEGLDEMACVGMTQVIEITSNTKKEYFINPNDLGLSIYPISALRGGNPTYNANALKQALQEINGAFSESLILNAGMATYLFDLVPTIKDGIQFCRELILQGRAIELLNKLTTPMIREI